MTVTKSSMQMSYNRGDIVWITSPFTNSTASKIRPALIISNRTINVTGDYLLMQVTSRIRNDDLSLTISNSDYTANPLLIQSQLRLHKIFILNEALIIRKASSVNNSFMKTVIRKFLLLIG